jgi:hypothetical protein
VATAIDDIMDYSKVPFALPIGLHASAGASSSKSLSPDEVILVPIAVPGPMDVHSLSAYINHTGTARGLEMALYQDTGSTTLELVTGTVCSVAWTPSAAGMKTVALAATVSIAPGVYWLAIRNDHASNNLSISYAGSTGAMQALNMSRSDTTTGVSGGLVATLDISAYDQDVEIYIAYVGGAVFGEATLF